MMVRCDLVQARHKLHARNGLLWKQPVTVPRSPPGHKFSSTRGKYAAVFFVQRRNFAQIPLRLKICETMHRGRGAASSRALSTLAKKGFWKTRRGDRT
jgi:hypothetical protein